jgi:membrane protease YdiL (CAAX protease family)
MRAVVAVLIALAGSNVMANLVLPGWTYVPWNVGVAAALVALARPVVTPQQMGLTRWRSGAAWGAVLFVLTAGVLLLGLTMPVFREMFHDRRVEAGVGTWLYQVVVRIPLGTALLEEVAFRAVLPALFVLRLGALRGYAAASVCFGLWHVLPALGLNEVNPVMTRWLGTGAGGVAVAVLFAVAGTTVAGLWWCWVRHRSGSVLATVLGHTASNSVAYTIAFLVNR